MSDHNDPFVLTEAYQVMPPLDDDEFAALKNSIDENGVQDPIVHDEDMQVIDGHHRVKACRELNRDMADVPTDARAGYTDSEKRNLAYRLNLQRRHLEHGQKSDLVEKYLTEEWDGDNSSEWYDSIANSLGVSSRLVQKIYTELKEAGKLRNFAIFSKGDKREQVRKYLEDNPDAANREVADNVEADVSHATVGNWKDKYSWVEDETDNVDEGDDDSPRLQSFGRANDAEDRAKTSKEIVDKATDEDIDDEVRETARENADAVNKGEKGLDEAHTDTRKQEIKSSREELELNQTNTIECIDDMEVLNLYAGIGGNRKLWGNDVDVTAIEYDSDIANIYRANFPQDTVIEADAHEYLIEHIDEFDFVWASPPCPTHGQMEAVNHVQNDMRYPDMNLYQEIIILQQHHERLNLSYCVENVVSYYEPLIEPQTMHRHYYWSNYRIPELDEDLPQLIKRGEEGREDRGDVGTGFDYDRHEKALGYDLSDFDIPKSKKAKALRNCVHPKLGKHILESSLEGWKQ